MRSLGCSAVFADQALDGLPAFDLGGDVDGLAGFVQRRSLAACLVGPVVVVVPRVLGQDVAEVLFAVDQQVVEALAAKCSDEPLGEGVGPNRQLRLVQMTGTDVCG